jgi:murein DD-endopeptidase MepM/ murein hydrolase activator NlpD
MSRTLLRAALMLLPFVACSDPVGHVPPTARGGVAFAIGDGAHGEGNARFFFLPPLVAAPSYSGDFDETLSPVVAICVWSGTACASTLAEFTMTSGPGSESVRMDADAEHYMVNWHTDQFALDPAVSYRARVMVAGTELGHADVDVLSSGKELKNVNTGDYIALVNGRTLPIKFRIEKGAVFVVGPSGRTITAADGKVSLVVPQGALSQDAGLTVTPSANPTSAPELVLGTVYEFGPAGLTFQKPVDLTIHYDPQAIPSRVQEASLRLHKQVGNDWVRSPSSSVNATSNMVAGPVTSFSHIGILGQTCDNPAPSIGHWPVCSSTLSLSQDYAEFADSAIKYEDKHHTGLDIAAVRGTLVLAASSGFVLRIQQNDGIGDHGYGNTIVICHATLNECSEGRVRLKYTQYSHLQSIDPALASACTGSNTDGGIGRWTCASPVEIGAGRVIGEVGGTGFGRNDQWPPHLHFELKSFPTLGTTSDDLSVGFGYTAAHPDSEHSEGSRYYDPLLILHEMTEIATRHVRVTTAGGGARLRVGPGSYLYRSRLGVLGKRALLPDDDFVAIRRSPPSLVPKCSEGWYQVKHSATPDRLPTGLVTETRHGFYFPEPVDSGSVPDGWVCAGDAGVPWVTVVSTASPDTLYKSGQFIAGNSLVHADGKLFFAAGQFGFSSLASVPVNGGPAEMLTPSMERPTGVLVSAGCVYWMSDGNIRRVAVDGSAVETLATGLSRDASDLSSFATDGSFLYFATSGGGDGSVQTINRMPVGGGAITPIVTTRARVAPFALHNGVIYYGNRQTAEIRSVPASGGESGVVASQVNLAELGGDHLTVVGDSVYLASALTGVISVVAIEGGSLSARTLNLGGMLRLYADDVNLYAEVVANGEGIFRFRISDFEASTISPSSLGGGLVLANGRLYWADRWLAGSSLFALVSLPR